MMKMNRISFAGILVAVGLSAVVAGVSFAGTCNADDGGQSGFDFEIVTEPETEAETRGRNNRRGVYPRRNNRGGNYSGRDYRGGNYSGRDY